MKFTYNFENINKNISFNLDKDIYKSEEVYDLLRSICIAIDYELMDIRDDIFCKIKNYIDSFED